MAAPERRHIAIQLPAGTLITKPFAVGWIANQDAGFTRQVQLLQRNAGKRDPIFQTCLPDVQTSKTQSLWINIRS